MFGIGQGDYIVMAQRGLHYGKLYSLSAQEYSWGSIVCHKPGTTFCLYESWISAYKALENSPYRTNPEASVAECNFDQPFVLLKQQFLAYNPKYDLCCFYILTKDGTVGWFCTNISLNEVVQ